MTTGRQPERQREVQRLLGRCMLRLQQYERLMKTLLANHELAGPGDTLDAQRESRVQKLSDKSLGTLVKALFETYAVPEGFERELIPEDRVPTDRISMAFSFRIAMPPERLIEVRTSVEELVAMRNELVHHLIERFDLWSDEGCKAAIRHLEQCYARIDLRHGELLGWAKGMDEARAHTAAFVQSDVFQDLLVNGIAPDGSVDWPASGIVRVLRDATTTLSVGGWTRLDLAREWVETTHPEQTPAKYGCRTWPQMLTESRLFDLVYRLDGDGKKVGWFRERPGH